MFAFIRNRIGVVYINSVTKRALQLPQALLGSRRLLFEILPFFQTIFHLEFQIFVCKVCLRVVQREGLLTFFLFVVVGNAGETANA